MNLKQLTFLSLLLLTCNLASAQKGNASKKIGITFSSFGENDVVRFVDLCGAASFNSKSFYTIGATYIHPINNWLDIETGVEYARHTISIHPNLPPDSDNSPRDASFSLINIPLTVKANFLKFFFVNGGVLLDIDGGLSSPIDSQTGLGAMFGFGAQYQFNNGIGLFVNPYARVHALVPFLPDTYHQRLLETGVRLGITYCL